jgi:hypothetical protein
MSDELELISRALPVATARRALVLARFDGRSAHYDTVLTPDQTAG